MRSTFAGLNTSVLGLYAQQLNLDTMGHNISNANTEGYSRQSVNLGTMPTSSVGGFYGLCEVGSGVNLQSVVRARDHFIDQQYWQQNATLNYGQTISDNMQKIEAVFKEPTETGISGVMNNFWNAWQALSTNAADYATRAVVKSSGQDLVDALKLASNQLKDNIADSNSIMKIKVAKVNQINSEISSLNGQIVQIESTGNNANDLRDSRDNLVNQLTSLVGATVREDSHGNYNIQISGNEVVNSSGYVELETRATKDVDYGFEKVNVYAKNSIDGKPLKFTDGELKAIQDGRDEDVVGAKYYLDQLVTLSKYFLQDFNAVHRAGMGTDNSTGNNFFGKLTAADGSGDYDYKNDPEGRFADWTKADWINALCVNPEISESTAGLGKIAAKTSNNGDITSTLVVPKRVVTSGKYGGNNPQPGTVKIIKDVNGKYKAVLTRQDNTTDTIDANYSGGKLSFTVDGMYVESTIDEKSATEIGYKIATDGSITTLDAIGNPINGTQKMTIKTAGDYTGGTSNTQVRIEKVRNAAGTADEYYYTVGDGARTQFDPIGPPPDTLKIAGLDVTVDAGNLPGAYGTYNFTLSQYNNASGDNAVNLANRMKNDTCAILGNTTLETFYASMVADLGVRSENAARLTSNQGDMVNSIVNWRESICGVSIDEELSNMIKFSKAYTASSRVLTTIDEMLDKLINSTGTVGR